MSTTKVFLVTLERKNHHQMMENKSGYHKYTNIEDKNINKKV